MFRVFHRVEYYESSWKIDKSVIFSYFFFVFSGLLLFSVSCHNKSFYDKEQETKKKSLFNVLKNTNMK